MQQQTAALPGACSQNGLVDYAASIALRMARRWTDSPEDAEDVAQEALIRFLRCQRTISRIEPWFYVVTRRISGCLRSRRLEEAQAQRRLFRTAQPGAPAYDTFISAGEVVTRLSHGDRKILSLALLGLSYAEMSRAISCPVNQVGQRLARARRRARHEARPREVV